MKNGKLRIVIGIILVLLQIVAVLGLEEINATLRDFTELHDSYLTAEPAELNLTTWLYGFYAGRYLLSSVFEELPDALAEDGFYYHETIPETITEKIRDGLTAGGHIFQRNLYNLNLRIAFNLFGILGAILIISGILAWRRKESGDAPGYVDILEGKLAAKLRIPAAIGCWICMLWHIPTALPILPEDLLLMAVFGCLAVYFTFYYGKKPSVLPAAALLLWGAKLLDIGLLSYFSFIGANTVTQFVYYGLTLLLYAPAGILYLLCGRKLLKTNTKKPIRWLFTVAAAAELLFFIYYVSQFAKFPVRMLKELMTCLPSILFLVLMGLYIWLVRDIPVVYRSDIPHQEPIPEGCCPMCRAPFTPGKTQCSRCGAALPGTAGSEEAPAKHTVRYCHNCGNMLEKDNRFCGQCGTPVWQPTETK